MVTMTGFDVRVERPPIRPDYIEPQRAPSNRFHRRRYWI